MIASTKCRDRRANLARPHGDHRARIDQRRAARATTTTRPRRPRSLPPVVAVVVTNDPGPWLEETLAALAAQDYPALSVLVLDNGSADDPTPRIAAALPEAFVRRRATGATDGLGFAAAANEALAAVEGAVVPAVLPRRRERPTPTRCG